MILGPKNVIIHNYILVGDSEMLDFGTVEARLILYSNKYYKIWSEREQNLVQSVLRQSVKYCCDTKRLINEILQ